MAEYSTTLYVVHTDRFGVEPRMFMFSRDAHAEGVGLSKRGPYRHAEIYVSLLTFTVNGDRLATSDQKVISTYLDGRALHPHTTQEESTT